MEHLTVLHYKIGYIQTASSRTIILLLGSVRQQGFLRCSEGLCLAVRGRSVEGQAIPLGGGGLVVLEARHRVVSSCACLVGRRTELIPRRLEALVLGLPSVYAWQERAQGTTRTFLSRLLVLAEL